MEGVSTRVTLNTTDQNAASSNLLSHFPESNLLGPFRCLTRALVNSVMEGVMRRVLLNYFLIHRKQLNRTISFPHPRPPDIGHGESQETSST